MTYYKILNDDMTSIYGKGKWILGEWMPEIEGDLVACKNGYHLCRREDLVDWLGPRIFEAEYRGDRVDSDNKIVVREVRIIREVTTWNERTARLFACDCAERALALVTDPDDRSVDAIRVARLYADGKATDKELSVAWSEASAAWSAAWSAAVSAAWSATSSAAVSAAWSAASAAASVAWSAVTREAWAAAVEREWQTERLFEYLEE